jgi:hypothetical protein
VSASASGKKSASLKVGQTWEIGIESGSPNPPKVQVSGPFGARTFTATKSGKGKYVAHVVLSQAGDYTATAQVGSDTLDGFTATAK